MVIQQHPVLTQQILGRIPAFRTMSHVAGSHHEKLDGSGYPNFLNARQLSLETRIVAVADVYAALSEERPYRAPLDLEEVTAIMAKDIPNKLDPECFDALLSTLHRDRESISA
jgi:HD-GYP domain-containing protein (c-di-GMP phosphodiesterase class II)